MTRLDERTADEITSRNYDSLMGLLCPWGSLDVWHMIKNAESCNISMNELSEILQDQANEWSINLYDSHTDVNALLNDYILRQAASDIESQTDIDIINDFDIYFFANYLDCPLQYSTECQETIEQVIKEKQLTKDDFDDYALYVLDNMCINFDYDDTTEEEV